jgi:hypothetical protein
MIGIAWENPVPEITTFWIEPVELFETATGTAEEQPDNSAIRATRYSGRIRMRPNA